MNDLYKKEVVEDIQRVAKQLGRSELSRSDYLGHGKYSIYHIYDGGTTWDGYCKQAGLKTKSKDQVSDEEYFQRLVEAVKQLGRYPRSSERKKFGLNMSKSRYPTLPDFIKKAAELGYVEDLFDSKQIVGKSKLDALDLDDKVELKHPPLELQGTLRPIPPIPAGTKRRNWQRADLEGFPYAPQEEQGVLAIFAILCSKRILPWQILDLCGGKGIDAVCYDEERKAEIHVELKYRLSRASWNHSIDDLDYVVCWENKWKDFPKPVIELSKLLSNK